MLTTPVRVVRSCAPLFTLGQSTPIDWGLVLVTSVPEPSRSTPVSTDLVEYMVLSVRNPDPEGLSRIGAELARSVESKAIRILDLVVIRVRDDGTPDVLEAESIDGLDAVRDVSTVQGVLLSHHDLSLIALALAPGDAAIVIVAEDRWAEHLAAAAHAVGGEIRAGERIARQRVEAALTGTTRATEENPR